jgi:hypothetical protein
MRVCYTVVMDSLLKNSRPYVSLLVPLEAKMETYTLWTGSQLSVINLIIYSYLCIYSIFGNS